jgi:hypothetical protein
MKPIAKSKAAAKSTSVLSLLLLCPMMSFSQGDSINLIRGGELLFGGLITIFSPKAKTTNSLTVESVCIKNKLEDKITFILTRQTEEGDEIRKELVIQKSSKEYFYELPKGVYTYEVQLANAEVFKKGEYRFMDKSTFVIDGDILKNPEE